MEEHNLDLSYENMPEDFLNTSQNNMNNSLNSNELNAQRLDDIIPEFPIGSNIWDSEAPAHLQMELSNVRMFKETSEECLRSTQQLEAKVDMVYSLLAILGGQEHADMGKTLLALSTNPDNCLAMRQSGCLPLLVQLVQSDRNRETRKKAAAALHNIVHSQPDEKLRKRESRILKILETLSIYSQSLENSAYDCNDKTQDAEKHPLQIVSQMMKYSFDEGYRQAICQLGGIHSIVKLIEAEHLHHQSITEDVNCNLMRRYACMVLTNLTFGDSGNKALLCSYKDFIRALVEQLRSPNDELRQVTASIFRNLSWRTDSTSQEILKDVGVVRGLINAAMLPNKENTSISILSALWNLSAHSTKNKSDICSVKGALVFLIRMLTEPSISIVENSGGVLRNISSTISTREDYRLILRQNNLFQILLEHLNSPNLTVVSNACGILWNLSSQNVTDQELLRTLGAPASLKRLSTSKHKVISMGSSATLKNLTTSSSSPIFSKKSSTSLPNFDVVVVATPSGTASLPTASKSLGTYTEEGAASPDDKEIYAETDLDQPTDYSLRYAEDSTTDSDDDETRGVVCEGAVKTAPEYVGDTVKTYCTEGTPYETPFNFSTSTSMSDLNDKNDVEKDAVKKRKDEEVAINVNKPAEFPAVLEPEIQAPVASGNGVASKPKSEYSSGLVSPEKPMNYCEEGTPGYFSRVSSFGSLNSSPVVATVPGKTSGKPEDVAQKETACNNETKVVKFENNINYCEETPLMFSRSSSLGSVDSIEQDDRSSVISDFSRLTSGIISPSELPDSPTQTVPPSPKPRKNHEFPVHHRMSNGGGGGSRPASRRSLPKTSVFEDKLMKFKEESTPTQYSIATSLSSLTIDDQDEHQLTEFRESSTSTEQTATKELFETMKNDQQAANEPQKLINYDDVNGNKLSRRIAQPSTSFQGPSSTTPNKLPDPKVHPQVHVSPLMVHNTLRTYCTEDTPAILSHNSSISDLSLSTLSMVDKEPMNRVYLSENSSQSSDGVKNINVEETANKNSNFERCCNKEKLDVATFMTSYDEVTSFAVEDSPMEFSLRSSLSNLTFESGKNFSPKSPASPPLELKNGEETIPEEQVSFMEDNLNNVEDINENVQECLEDLVAEENCEKLSEFHEDIPSSLGSSNLYGSLKLRKWKWKWKFSSEGNSSKENIDNSSEKTYSNDIETFNSLDMSYKKKKWWKWKFGSKDPEQPNEDEVDSKNLNGEQLPVEKNEDRSESYRNRKKSKKWKWKWKFSSKEDDKSENSLPEGFVKSKYSESFREPSKSQRESRSNTITPIKLSRSVSEPRKRDVSKLTSIQPMETDRDDVEEFSSEINKVKEKVIEDIEDLKMGAETIDGPSKSSSEVKRGENNFIDREINKSKSSVESLKVKQDKAQSSKSNMSYNSISSSELAPNPPAEGINEEKDVQGLEKFKSIKITPSINSINYNSQAELATNNEVMKLCSEEPLDPVTISIIKRVLQRRFSKGDDVDKILKDIDMKVSEFNPEDCNFEIVLEERIKVTLAKNGETATETGSLRCKKSHLKQIKDQNFEEVSREIGNVEENIKSRKSPDYSSLIEECIQLGINKKKDNHDEEAIYANVSMSPGYSRSMTRNRKEICSNTLPVRSNVMVSEQNTNINSPTITPIPKRAELIQNNTKILNQEKLKNIKNPDYAALLEECIQLGMPKKKDVMLKESEVRSSLPNIDSSPSFSRNRTVESSTLKVENNKNYMALVEECIQFGMPKKKGESEEAIYANITSSTRFNNSGAIKKLKDTTTSKSTSCLPERSTVQVDFESNQHDVDINNYYSLKRDVPIKRHDNNDKKHENEMLIQECIQLGMPRKKEPEEVIYTNTMKCSTFKTSTRTISGIPRLSPKKMTRSDSEPNPTKIVHETFSDNRRGTSSISINRTALEECIQLGWPKKKEGGASNRSVVSSETSMESAPKNVNVASVARNIQESRRAWCKMTATGAGDELEYRNVPDKIERSGITETFLTGLRRNGYN